MKELNKVSIEKEGELYTLYINDLQCGCGYLEDLIRELEENKDDLVGYAKSVQDFY